MNNSEYDKRRFLFSIIFLLGFGNMVFCQSEDGINRFLSDSLPIKLTLLKEFVDIPNYSENFDDIYENLDFLEREFVFRGFTTKALNSTSLPIFIAEQITDPDLPTIMFYFHVDGQAVNPGNWDQDSPYNLVLKQEDKKRPGWNIIKWKNIQKSYDHPEWRMFGRSVADDKGPIVMLLSAFDYMKSQNKSSRYNIKVLIDCQEERGSEALVSTLDKYSSEYAADYMFLMDGPMHASNLPTLVYGFRGIVYCDLTVYGAKLPQHSGHFGNYAPNPVFEMAHLLSSMKDENGKVLIDGYYDNISFSEDIQTILNSAPENNSEINTKLVIAKQDDVGKTYQESLQYPSLNVRHISTSWKGEELKTIIPDYVTVNIDIRLVQETKGADMIDKVKQHLIGQGYYITDETPSDDIRLKYDKVVTMKYKVGSNAYRADHKSSISSLISSKFYDEFGDYPVKIRTMGGTLPLSPLIEKLGIPAINIPTVNSDNNQHNPNENLRVGNFIQGVQIFTALLSLEV